MDFEEGELKSSLQEIIHLDEHETLGINVGQNYTVYGIDFNFFIHEMPFYYICEEKNSDYPVPCAAVFFEIIDAKPSAYWNFVFERNEDHRSALLFSEWAKSKEFYERLVDGEDSEQILFHRYKALLDSEWENL